jgi:hypothetical protein
MSRTSRSGAVWLLCVLCLLAVTMPGTAVGRAQPTATDSYGAWEPFIGTDPLTPAIPDFYANYFAFSFKRTGNARFVGLRLTGDFGYARYMSFNIYRAHKGPSFGALTDDQVLPAPGSVNPFVPGTSPNATNRAYVVNVQPVGYATNPEENTLTFDPSQIRILTVIVRYYVPQGSVTAGVPLPTIEAYDVRTKQSAPLPEQYLIGDRPTFVFRWIMRPIFKTAVDNKVRFYHAVGLGQFPNADSLYLLTAVERRTREVIVLRFKPPTFPHDTSEYGATQVRYWSLNEENRDTTTAFGMKDDQFTRADDGFVYVAIGDRTLRRQAEKRGYNFMPWRIKGREGVIIYRHLVTDASFPGSFDQVPVLDPNNPRNIYLQNATRFIGDYAPRGVKISLKQFLKNGGGIAPPRR